ncbi:SNARE domain-containing protein [Pseudomassariella vexata]|uniref:SNARE domain-containing protein n=1 Tax=Pseudomassariella vexata TaxID=1141098 RepID=A0A1Y2DDE5_9PEZI|nr:SNARE domain-containing protein [Pseudomassariella vexata]ORY57278.1 SNARE domain-containing protein [Pseudomassariella vexata]
MSYGQYQNNPYSQGPEAEQGYGYDQNQGHEMQPYPQDSNPVGSLSQQDFLQRIGLLRDEIGTLTKNVQAIASLHQRALAESDNGLSAQQLERLVSETQALNRGIRDQLKFLATDASRTTDGSEALKNRQVNTIKNDFECELKNYQKEESSYRQRYRDQIARQYRIVNPEASDDEVRQATEADWGNEGVFQTALRTNRTGQATSVLGNVRARHNELQKIEQTLIELASMFQDIAVLVEQQETPVQTAEQNAENTTKWTEEGNVHVGKGIKSARNARKWKWYCLLLVVLIIIAIALGVGLGIYFRQHPPGSN